MTKNTRATSAAKPLKSSQVAPSEIGPNPAKYSSNNTESMRHLDNASEKLAYVTSMLDVLSELYFTGDPTGLNEDTIGTMVLLAGTMAREAHDFLYKGMGITPAAEPVTEEA